jgi:hypothetical protein
MTAMGRSLVLNELTPNQAMKWYPKNRRREEEPFCAVFLDR